MNQEKLDLLKQLNDTTSSESSQPKSSRKKRVGHIALLFVFLTPIILFGFFFLKPNPIDLKEDSAEKAFEPNPVVEHLNTASSATQESSERRGNLVASGYVVARRMATIAAETTGQIEEVFVEEGMRVEKGQPIAKLNATLLKTEKAVAEAHLKAAMATANALAVQLKEADFLRERNQKLYDSGVLSESAFVEARTKAESLAAQWEQAKSSTEALKIEVQRREELIEKSLLRAPFAGVVVDKNAQPGEIISPMSAGSGFTRSGIATLVDMDSLEVEVDVNEANISKVQAQQEGFATLDAYPSWKIPAEVIAVIPTANKEKATIRVRVRLKEKNPKILPNMAVKVNFILLEN